MHRPCASPEQLEPVLDAQQADGAEAHGDEQDDALEQRLQQRIDVEDAKSRSPMVRSTKAPKIEPMALPTPPISEVPPITTAAIEFSV